MTDEGSFAALRARLDAREGAAAGEVFHRFAGRLIALARRQFEPRLAFKVDPEDVVQSAFKSFFARHRRGALRFENWGGLWGLLTRITLRKCSDRAHYLRAQRRDVTREASAPGGQDQPWQLAPD